jgi:hypothetical protein
MGVKRSMESRGVKSEEERWEVGGNRSEEE